MIRATTATTTTSTKKTVLVAFYFFICSIRLRWDFARNSEADISKRELSIDSETDIASRCSHLNCTVPVCMHLCSHIAWSMYACICVSTLHCSCLPAYVFAHCMFHVSRHLCSHIACFMPQLPLTLTRPRTVPYGSELTKHTHKSIKGSMGASSHTIWERTHQTTREDDMDTLLVVCYICLSVCLFFVYKRH